MVFNKTSGEAVKIALVCAVTLATRAIEQGQTMYLTIHQRLFALEVKAHPMKGIRKFFLRAHWLLRGENIEVAPLFGQETAVP